MSDQEERLRKLERLLEISRELTSTVELEPLLNQIVDIAAELTNSDQSSIMLLDMRTGELRFQAARGDQLGQLRDIPVPVKGSLGGTVFVTGEPIITSDARSDPRHYVSVDEEIDHETTSLLAVPLQYKDRRIGVLEALNKRDNQEFDQTDLEILTTLAAQATVAIETARLVAALQAAYNRLADLDRRKSDFIAIASHELRTPLGLILGYASALREDAEGATAGQLEVVVRASSRLQHIIESMLNLSYLDTGEMELRTHRLDICSEVEEACAEHHAMSEAKDLVLEVEVPADTVFIEADKEKVRVVLDNLISNAIRHTPSGGTVRLRVKDRRSEIEIEVQDSGEGIPPDELERIFDRFYQVEHHMTRRYGGMGLGLSIVKGLIELHGGRVWAESKVGEGSRFVIVLPAQPTR
jgi:signal transduction histidine kinase